MIIYPKISSGNQFVANFLYIFSKTLNILKKINVF